MPIRSACIIHAIMKQDTAESGFLEYLYYHTNAFGLLKKDDYIGNPYSGIAFYLNETTLKIDDLQAFFEVIHETYGTMSGCREMIRKIRLRNPIMLFWSPRSMAA